MYTSIIGAKPGADYIFEMLQVLLHCCLCIVFVLLCCKDFKQLRKNTPLFVYSKLFVISGAVLQLKNEHYVVVTSCKIDTLMMNFI